MLEAHDASGATRARRVGGPHYGEKHGDGGLDDLVAVVNQTASPQYTGVDLQDFLDVGDLWDPEFLSQLGTDLGRIAVNRLPSKEGHVDCTELTDGSRQNLGNSLSIRIDQ